MIQDLKNIFSKFAKLNIFLYNFEFNMTIVNFKKTFDMFFTRFILIIILLDFKN